MLKTYTLLTNISERQTLLEPQKVALNAKSCSKVAELNRDRPIRLLRLVRLHRPLILPYVTYPLFSYPCKYTCARTNRKSKPTNYRQSILTMNTYLEAGTDCLNSKIFILLYVQYQRKSRVCSCLIDLQNTLTILPWKIWESITQSIHPLVGPSLRTYVSPSTYPY